MQKSEFVTFFEEYSQNVDSAAELHFWRFSDRLILEILKRHITGLTPASIVLDAGGGTGRWIPVLAKEFPAQFVLYDLSEDMLEKASLNIERAGLKGRTKIIQGDLERMDAISDASVDIIVSLYAPIGFVTHPQRAAAELFRVLRPGGTILIAGHGYHNALASKVNNYLAPAGELEWMQKEYQVKWAEYVPALHTFSAESMTELLAHAGFDVKSTYGVPIYAQPGPEDFDRENRLQSRISTYLSDDSAFEALVRLEMSSNSDPALVNRGVNILGVGKKP